MDFCFLVREQCFVFFVGGEYVAILDAGFVMSNDDSSVICVFNCFEDSLVDFCCIDLVIFLFWTDIEGTFGGESVVLYRCSGCVFDAALLNCFFGIIILTFMFFIVVKAHSFSLF